MDDYGKYFDQDGKMIEGREENYRAFLYHVDRILPSVNADITKYQGDRRCEIPMSAAFRITDEAFALLMVENYYERWVKLAEEFKKTGKKETSGAKRKRLREIPGKYTSCSNGNVHGGWDDRGISRYNELCEVVKVYRMDKPAKDRLDGKLKNHWRGVQDENESDTAKKRKVLPVRVQAFVDLGDEY